MDDDLSPDRGYIHRQSARHDFAACQRRADTCNTRLIYSLAGRTAIGSSSMLNYFPFEPGAAGDQCHRGRAFHERGAWAPAYVSDPVTDSHAIGGKNRNNTVLASSRDTFRFKTSSCQDFEDAPMPQARYGAFADGIAIFVVGGPMSDPVNTVFRYTIATDT